MKACHCTLNILNPEACKNCPNNTGYYESLENYTFISPYDYKPFDSLKKKRIIKEYDKDGKLIKEIIEDI